MKKALVIHGSPRKNGYSTYLALKVINRLKTSNTLVEEAYLYDLNIEPCIACDSCRKEKSNYCVIQDDMRVLYPKIVDSDVIIFASPIYWFSVNAKTKLFIDRFYGFNTEKTKILKDKSIGIILSYGDSDPYSSGAINAIRMFEDAFTYTGSKIKKILYKTEVSEKERKTDKDLEEEISAFVENMIEA